MSDDLSPVEQARAARWAADWLMADEHCWSLSGQIWADGLLAHANALDLPETVESLRAERDAARKQGEGFRRDWLGACADLNAANDTIARLRATHTQAEAARGRCARED